MDTQLQRVFVASGEAHAQQIRAFLEAAGIATIEQLADLSPEDLENIPGIGSKTVEKIKDILSEYYAQLPSYQDVLERAAAEHMFSKSVDEPAEEASEAAADETAKEANAPGE